MRKIYLLLGLILFFSVYACQAKTPKELLKESPAPAAKDPYLWDFGKVRAGQILKHDFILKNESKKNMVIGNVDTSCGCTASEVKKNILSPGESTSVRVTFNSKGYSGAAQQYVYASTDDPENAIIKFTIRAFVSK